MNDLNRSPNNSESQENKEIVENSEQTDQEKDSSKKVPASQRREAIIKLIKTVGFRNTRKRQKGLSETYKVSQRMIRKDFDWIKKNITPEDIKEIMITVRIAIDKSLDTALEQFATQPTIDNSQKIMDIAKKYREEIEAWGEKEKVADKHEISREDPLKIEVKIPEDIKKLFEQQS